MLATCEHCGHQNDVPDDAANTPVLCQKCFQAFFAVTPQERAADRRATKLLIAAVLIVCALIAMLLGSRSGSRGIQLARQMLVGADLAARFGEGGNGNGNGNGNSEREGNGEGDPARNGNGNANAANGSSGGSSGGRSSFNGGLPDPLATNAERSPDRSIGRLPQNIARRKAGDETRPGAAGSDEPAAQIGNSPGGQITNAPSAGGNPGNSDIRNSVETPDGADPLTGHSLGSDASAPLTSTNSRNNALLLDDFSERLRQAGARSGDLQISLEWKNVNDLDLHVIDPSGERIFYNHRYSRSGGHLDVDMNAHDELTSRPVENVYWPERGAPRGLYRVEVMHFANHGGRDPTPFTVRIVNKGQPTYYRGYISYIHSPERATVTVCTFGVQ
jgi:hypothetical protein